MYVYICILAGAAYTPVAIYTSGTIRLEDWLESGQLAATQSVISFFSKAPKARLYIPFSHTVLALSLYLSFSMLYPLPYPFFL